MLPKLPLAKPFPQVNFGLDCSFIILTDNPFLSLDFSLLSRHPVPR
jgi:hypothetical protein